MLDLDWRALALYVAAVLLLALYGLTASGHFPAEHRGEKLRHGWGAALLWATMASTAVAGVMMLIRAWSLLPWHALVIGGGVMLLLAPLLLQPLPDSFVDGRCGLLVFGFGAVLFAAALWLGP
jgi:hypothetical protein